MYICLIKVILILIYGLNELNLFKLYVYLYLNMFMYIYKLSIVLKCFLVVFMWGESVGYFIGILNDFRDVVICYLYRIF